MESSPVSTLNNDQLVIAIDGPSGSGKSSVSKAVARELGAAYLDTGAMYRAITYSVLADGTDLSDANAIAQAVRDAQLEISVDPDAELVQIGGVDVTAAIREPRISEQVSTVATNLDARAELVRRQQEIIKANLRIVAEGRDITTVVAPDADARILLTASEEARLRRRGLQLGGTQNDSQLANQVLARDAKDSTVVNFTQAADGVMTVDSSDLDFEQTIAAVLDAISTATKN
ncbi:MULTISPECIES: (d)CMP kinase [Glutamicibacter]|uniref:Cytidylate kinase n=1 Tax=Glutamicibacter halophytocola TaxID=1933880 RepID=A0AA94XY66_9MICC|nr:MULTISPECIES: (d)CMP kinase [Glutamicibacter]MBF6672155.1 (d)CMP kinase [Glutamicibacter sp. FBE19]UUX60107.1 (d)CMP kinase [Glutamicibacter halophytocola]